MVHDRSAAGGVVEKRPADGVMWEFRDRVVEGVTFRGVRDGDEWLSFKQVTFLSCTFEDCNLQWDFGVYDGQQQTRANVVGCRILGCDLRHFALSYLRIEGVHLRGMPVGPPGCGRSD